MRICIHITKNSDLELGDSDIESALRRMDIDIERLGFEIDSYTDNETWTADTYFEFEFNPDEFKEVLESDCKGLEVEVKVIEGWPN